MSSIRWLSSGSTDAFPSQDEALDEPNGLLAAGGDLRAERLLLAYENGIFPWYERGQPILWWCPNPRAVLLPPDLHVSRSLRKLVNRRRFEISADAAFDLVVEGCAAPRRCGSATWITEEMAAAYRALHRLGWAHSFEAWEGGQLAGGLYGVAIGRAFFGESMFARADNASKVAFVNAVRYLQARGFELIDCQIESAHLASLGAMELPRAQFLARLSGLCRAPRPPSSWTADYREWSRTACV